MDDFEINITPDAISVRTRKIRRVKDQDTGEVLELPEIDHRRAIGLGDHGGDANAFRAAVASLIAPVLGASAADVVGRATAAEAERDVAKADATRASAEADTASAQREDADRKAEEARQAADTAQARVAELEAELEAKTKEHADAVASLDEVASRLAEAEAAQASAEPQDTP